MTIRHVRELLRQPWWIAVTLVQPVIWLLLFGALFKNIIRIPGFHGTSYIEFLAPGVVAYDRALRVGVGWDAADRRHRTAASPTAFWSRRSSAPR